MSSDEVAGFASQEALCGAVRFLEAPEAPLGACPVAGGRLGGGELPDPECCLCPGLCGARPLPCGAGLRVPCHGGGSERFSESRGAAQLGRGPGT